MAPKTIALRFGLTLALLLAMSAAVLPSPAAASPLLPDLQTFRASLKDGSADVLRGVYAEGLFAAPVTQQPSSDPGFVSASHNAVTQFRLAAQYGNVGLLAHNYLSGQYFSESWSGERMYLIYGDGRIEPYLVSGILAYQATDPSSVTSTFIDLNTNKHLTASELFAEVYRGPKHLTLQTCIAKNGNSSWGRLFVIAEPAAASTSAVGRDSQPAGASN